MNTGSTKVHTPTPAAQAHTGWRAPPSRPARALCHLAHDERDEREQARDDGPVDPARRSAAGEPVGAQLRERHARRERRQAVCVGERGRRVRKERVRRGAVLVGRVRGGGRCARWQVRRREARCAGRHERACAAASRERVDRAARTLRRAAGRRRGARCALWCGRGRGGGEDGRRPGRVGDFDRPRRLGLDVDLVARVERGRRGRRGGRVRRRRPSLDGQCHGDRRTGRALLLSCGRPRRLGSGQGGERVLVGGVEPARRALVLGRGDGEAAALEGRGV